MNPLIYADYYKTEHFRMYPEGMQFLYSNFTPRKSRIKGVNKIVFFGLQHFVKKYLINKFKTDFFDRPWEEVDAEYKFAIDVDTSHIKALHELGYLPIKIKAVKEGTLVNIGVPCLTICNTNKKFAWLVNYLETLMSAQLWQPITSATIAYEYKKLLTKYAKETGGDLSFIPWQGHDFSMRGMSSIESAVLSGMGHLTSFTGTDTIPAIYAIKEYYGSNSLIGASVPATEHSVMCMGTKESELETFRRLLKLYPTGILSIVSDTWNLWKVLTEYLPTLKDEILARDGKIVIRPDSGDPVKIITGYLESEIIRRDNVIYEKSSYLSGADEVKTLTEEEVKGVIQLLWDEFGGTVNEKGFKVLDSHVGAIYGDSISLDRAQSISERLSQKGICSTSIVYGIGSYTYQYNTRDTFGFAMKATYGEVNVVDLVSSELVGRPITVTEAREIYKDPITDDGTKKSAKGLLRVDRIDNAVFDGFNFRTVGYDLRLTDQVSKEEERKGELELVFEDGRLLRSQTIDEIRDLLEVND